MHAVRELTEATYEITNYDPKRGSENSKDLSFRVSTIASQIFRSMGPLKAYVENIRDFTNFGHRAFTAGDAECGTIDQAYKVGRATLKLSTIVTALFAFSFGMTICATLNVGDDAIETISNLYESGFSRDTFNAFVDLVDSTIEAIVMIFAARIFILVSLGFDLFAAGLATFSEIQREHYMEAIAWIGLAAILNRCRISSARKEFFATALKNEAA